jgi:hypothetical protein
MNPNFQEEKMNTSNKITECFVVDHFLQKYSESNYNANLRKRCKQNLWKAYESIDWKYKILVLICVCVCVLRKWKWKWMWVWVWVWITFATISPIVATTISPFPNWFSRGKNRIRVSLTVLNLGWFFWSGRTKCSISANVNSLQKRFDVSLYEWQGNYKSDKEDKFSK